MYRLTIEHFVENPGYEEEKTAFEKLSSYTSGPIYGAGPQAQRLMRVLTVDLTDAEFQEIKKGVLAVM